MNAALKYDYVSGHGLSEHPGWTVLLRRFCPPLASREYSRVGKNNSLTGLC